MTHSEKTKTNKTFDRDVILTYVFFESHILKVF